MRPQRTSERNVGSFIVYANARVVGAREARDTCAYVREIGDQARGAGREMRVAFHALATVFP